MSQPIRIAVAGLLLITIASCERSPEPDELVAPEEGLNADPASMSKVGADVLEALRRGESPSVVVALDVEGTGEVESREDLSEVRSRVADAQDETLEHVRREDLQTRRLYRNVPAFSAVVRSEAAVRRMASNPRVRRIDLDLAGTGTLETSVPFIRADLRHDRGNEGADIVVAILDTGVDSDHPDFSGALVAEACFGDDDGSIDGNGFCPGGSDRETGPGSGEDDAGHGTHVAGIVASRGTVSGAGVAPAASLVSIKITDDCTFSGCFYSFGEIVAALDYIIDNNDDLGVDLINMSIGTGALYNGDCDNTNANAMAGAAAINTLRGMGVTAFASAGNNSSGTQMPLPACIANVISVGASDESDQVAGFSNSNAQTDIFAPGVNINSLAIGGGTTLASGTSMASPHAAGCAALLMESGDAVTPADIETRLETSGAQVTDPTNDLSFPRIDCVPDDNAAPAVAADVDPVTVDEGQLAENSGSFSDSDGDDVSLSVSVGAIGEDGPGSWTWSYATTDGPAESQSVTVTATDVLDATDDASFALNVLNVAPSVDAGPDGAVQSGDDLTVEASFSDPGVIDDPWSYEFDWGFGMAATGSTSDQSATLSDTRTVCAAGDYTIQVDVTDKDGDTGSGSRTVTVEHVAIDILIKPNGSPNPINLRSRGRLPVAVLSTAGFDATTLDVATIALGDETGTDTPVDQRRNGTYFASAEDVNDDGLMDLVLHFSTSALVDNGDLTSTSTELVLRAFLDDGCTNVRGSDAVVIRP
jgi:subtilisin family serine protease